MSDFYIKKGDRLPKIRSTLQSPDGTALNLTGATGVTFRMRLRGATSVVFSSAATVVTAASGIVEYTWGATDTATAGTYDAEWVVDWGGGIVQTVPNADFVGVLITNKLG